MRFLDVFFNLVQRDTRCVLLRLRCVLCICEWIFSWDFIFFCWSLFNVCVKRVMCGCLFFRVVMIERITCIWRFMAKIIRFFCSFVYFVILRLFHCFLCVFFMVMVMFVVVVVLAEVGAGGSVKRCMCVCGYVCFCVYLGIFNLVVVHQSTFYQIKFMPSSNCFLVSNEFYRGDFILNGISFRFTYLISFEFVSRGFRFSVCFFFVCLGEDSKRDGGRQIEKIRISKKNYKKNCTI